MLWTPYALTSAQPEFPSIFEVIEKIRSDSSYIHFEFISSFDSIYTYWIIKVLSLNLNILSFQNLSGFFGTFFRTFYADQRVKNRNELSEQHLTSVIFY